MRGDAAAGVQALLRHLSNLGLQYSVGVNARQPVADALAALSRRCWQSAIVTTGRRHWLRLPRGWPWAELIINGHTRLLALT